ncbi:MAG: hypothetical protein ACRDV9_03200 [Acidimicrobiia bacterium]
MNDAPSFESDGASKVSEPASAASPVSKKLTTRFRPLAPGSTLARWKVVLAAGELA